MVLSLSTNETPAPPALDEAEQTRLLALAEDAIAAGLENGRYPGVVLEDLPPRLRAPGASFITLHHHGRLRGCIGNLAATRPLAEDVAHNAYAAAFRDPRFEPLGPEEFLDLHVEISLLSPLEPLRVDSEAALLAEVEPGLDGLVVECGHRRATFLPKVWEALPEPHRFLAELKKKAGLAPGQPFETLRFWRYRTRSFGSHVHHR